MNEKERLTNFRFFKVKYLGATNYRGSRVKIYDLRHEKSVTIPYDGRFNNTWEMAETFLESMNITCCGVGECPDGYILFSDNFRDQIK